MNNPEQLFQEALQCHRSGRVDQAEQMYRQLLGMLPDAPPVLHFLGLLLCETGRADSGLPMLEHSVALQPGVAEHHNNLATVLQSLGRHADAAGAFRKAIVVRPDYPEAWFNLGNALYADGAPEGAEEAWRRALALRPDYVKAGLNLGHLLFARDASGQAVDCLEALAQFPEGSVPAWNALAAGFIGLGRRDRAIGYCQRILGVSPDHVETLATLGRLLTEEKRYPEGLDCFQRLAVLQPGVAEHCIGVGVCRLGMEHAEDAVSSFRRALALQPGLRVAHMNLGYALKQARRHEAALESFRAALALHADFEVLNELGNTTLELAKAGKEGLQTALDYYTRAIELAPVDPRLHCNVGRVHWLLGEAERATDAYRRAVECDPSFEPAYVSLGHVMQLLDRHDEAIDYFRRIMTRVPEDYRLHSYLIWYLDRAPGVALSAMQEERRRWDERHVQARNFPVKAHANIPDPDRRIRVGIVSGEFYECSAAYAFLPFILYADREAFEVTCYSNTATEDRMAERIRRGAARWRNIVDADDEMVAETIRQDGIDILLDISSHSWTTTRLPVFGRKPAPIQVTGWGYASGTGMVAMDYLLSDPLSVRPGERALFAEEICDLPCVIGYLCPEDAPPVRERGGAGLTFGSLNHPDKLSDETLRLWGELLAGLPGSRLILKYNGLENSIQQRRILGKLATAGVSPERVTILGGSNWQVHMDTYNRVDIALDPFPSGGGITTYEAVWMGTPVVTLYGEALVQRSTAAILSGMGQGQWIARSRQEYLDIARALAENREALRRLHGGMRDLLRCSEVSHENYVRATERAFREMWRRWCGAAQSKGNTGC